MPDDPRVNAIQKYENPPSMIKIKSFVETTQSFDFDFVNTDDISKIIRSNKLFPKIAQRCLDASDGIAVTLSTDLSNAYNCVNHDLITAKLEAYGVGKNTLKTHAISQGPVLEPILFNILIND